MTPVQIGLPDLPPPPRPRALSPERAQAVAGTMADILIGSHGFNPKDRDEIIDDLIAHASPHQDGYQFAKALDERCGWNCTLEIADELDHWDGLYHASLYEMQREWVEAYRIEPPYPIGTKVIVLSDRASGEIAGIYPHGPAKYLIKIDNDPRAKPPPAPAALPTLKASAPAIPSRPPIPPKIIFRTPRSAGFYIDVLALPHRRLAGLLDEIRAEVDDPLRRPSFF